MIIYSKKDSASYFGSLYYKVAEKYLDTAQDRVVKIDREKNISLLAEEKVAMNRNALGIESIKLHEKRLDQFYLLLVIG